MIRVPLTAIVFLYLFIFLAVIAANWFLDLWRRQRRQHHALQFRMQCAICGFEFEDHSTNSLPNCPRCGRPNERVAIDPL